MDRKGAAEYANQIISIPTDDPVGAEALISDGKYNKLDAVIHRAAEDISQRYANRDKVNQCAALTTISQKERNRMTGGPRFRYMGALYMLWLIGKLYTVISDDHNELRPIEQMQRLTLRPGQESLFIN